MTTSRLSDAADIIEVAKQSVPAQAVPHDEPVVLIKDGTHLEDMEEYGIAPRRRKAHVIVHEADSLIRYVVAQGVASARLYGNMAASTVVAVIDDHQLDQPAWREHVATLQLALSIPWKLWQPMNGHEMSQKSFADHIEDGQPEIVKPDAADMLEMAMKFEATTKVEFKSGIRLASGERQLTYVENVEAGGGAQKNIVIPERFIIRLPVYEGGDLYEVECRLRYRIDSGTLKIGYKMIRPEDIVREAFIAEVRKVETGTKVAAVIGIP